ncbi:MAG: hypothetical protein IJQ73_08305 [Kiritimatiellae bacterium]|nr:hypothetical protein [Kiritimatiellia bacterium]
MAISTVEFDLSMIDQSTGRYMTANAYTVDGITNADGSPRELSIGQLVMAICLDRASRLEAGIIDLMNDMNLTSAQLEAMTTIEEALLAGTVNMNQATLTYNGASYTYKQFLTDETVGIKMTGVPDSANADSKEFISSLEAKMDEKNSFSQRTMIDLQSQTSKRDQCYDMISNILKSLNTVLVGNANNM